MPFQGAPERIDFLDNRRLAGDCTHIVSTVVAPKSSKRRKTSSARVNLRINAAEKRRLKEAATLSGQNLTDFVLTTSLTAADMLLASRTHFKISEENWIKFNEMLDRPARDLPGLKKLFSKPSIFTAE